MKEGFVTINEWGIYINKKVAEKVEYRPRANITIEYPKIIIEFSDKGEYSVCCTKGGLSIPCRSKVKNLKKGRYYEVFVRDNKVIVLICQQ